MTKCQLCGRDEAFLSECAGEAGRKRYYACIRCRERLFKAPNGNGVAEAKRWVDLSAEDLEFAMWVKRRRRAEVTS